MKVGKATTLTKWPIRQLWPLNNSWLAGRKLIWSSSSYQVKLWFFLFFLFWWSLISYIALFSTLLSRLTALACGFTWVTSFIVRFLNVHRSGVLTALAWLVRHETAAVSAQVMCTPYNHAPCHFMQSQIRKVYVCFAVTCHLHFCRMTGIFYVLLQ